MNLRLEKDRRVKSLSSLTATDIASLLANAHQSASDGLYLEVPYPSELIQGEPRPAAVLIPLLRKENAWHVLFTRRTDTLPEHSGQVAFPGGRSEPGDLNAEGTALREASEEIGLKPTDVKILGRLNEFITITNYRVTPVVGLIPWPFSLQLEKREVSRVFTIPLDWLADPANREEQLRPLPPPYAPVMVIYFHPYDNEILWGASARFTVTLLKILSL
jgi:8-oxo-dGTP pyrophosphatase MutT (NUDIX family)